MPRPKPSRSSSESLSSDSRVAESTPDLNPQPIPIPPLYEIDLSSPASQRWNRIIRDFREPLQQASHLYASILDQTGWPKVADILARGFLRKVYDREEQGEVEGIARESGMRMCEVVAYNTFLDMFSGCASGGVRARVPSPIPSPANDGNGTSARKAAGKQRMQEATRSTMVHFRNLDWGMDVLRDLLIRVDYVREGKVVARSITYAGYVGVLTGVREGLSISLNYRPRLSANLTTTARTLSSMKHYTHYLLVLLGARPSTPSLLRSLLLSPESCPSLDEITERLRVKKSGPCYLTFCSPEEVLIVEKRLDGVQRGPSGSTAPERSTGGEQAQERQHTGHGMRLRPRKETQKGVINPKQSKGNTTAAQTSTVPAGGLQRERCFAVVTNHDREAEGLSKEQWATELEESAAAELEVGGVDWIIKDSLERKRCVEDMRKADRSRRSAKATRRNLFTEGEEDVADLEEVKHWLRTYPVRNECTHFSCIMDPSQDGGGLLCVQ